jgi:hypothetical protein
MQMQLSITSFNATSDSTSATKNYNKEKKDSPSLFF